MILAQLESYIAKRPGHFWAGVGLLSVSLFGMVAAFGTVTDLRSDTILRRQVVESLTLPPLSAIDGSNESYFHEDRVRSGDTVTKLMDRLGVDDDSALDFLRTDGSAQILFRQLGPGKSLSAWTDIDGDLLSLSFPLNGGDKMLVVNRTGEGFKANQQTIKLDTEVVMKSAEIRYSLFGASDAAGIPDAVAMQLADIFGGDVDFHRDLRKGDHFSVVYESFNHLGTMVRSGRILAAEFVNDCKTYRAAWFQDPGQPHEHGGYYTADGKSIHKPFLRSPLEFSRITSGFSFARFHPILKTWRAHKGIDYGAPIGARVKATGNAIVEFAGKKGGYGNAIILSHQGGYTTLYGHLSGFAKGLRKGARVGQGDVIGYVGMPGMATGPHLHYEFRINGVYQNPLAVVLPPAPPLGPRQLALFRQQTAMPLAQLELIRGLNVAQLD